MSVSTTSTEPTAEATASDSPWGFTAGAFVGVLLTLSALGMGSSTALPEALELDSSGGDVLSWIALNLGHSFWFFALVLALFLLNLHQLSGLLRSNPESSRVAELDQLSDVWMHLFVGIGVIWTAVGMRSALQAALGDAGAAEGVIDSADNVLRKLVDGGILLALTTTIVGGVGGYLMRLFKTVIVGSQLQDLFDKQQRADVQALVAATERIESRLPAGELDKAQRSKFPERSQIAGADDAYAPSH